MKKSEMESEAQGPTSKKKSQKEKDMVGLPLLKKKKNVTMGISDTGSGTGVCLHSKGGN